MPPLLMDVETAEKMEKAAENAIATFDAISSSNFLLSVILGSSMQ